MRDTFETEPHAKELDMIYGIKPANQIEEYSKIIGSFNHFNIEWRLIRKQLASFFRKPEKKEDFKTILYLTLEPPPLGFISAFRKQYPDKIIKVLMPIVNTNDTEKLVFDFEYYLQNRTNNAHLYKMKHNDLNIDVYGLYSEAFSGLDLTKLQYLAPFVKAARIAAQKLNPKIIHSNNIPFFLGLELEKKSHYPIKVFQVINDFSKFEAAKEDVFWAALNLLDFKGMKKLCGDTIIKKCIASLFNLYNSQQLSETKECLDFIYQNYYKFRNFEDKSEVREDENILFNRLNARVLMLFPKMAYENDLYYNTMFYTLRRANLWAVPSKTYYNDIMTRPELTGKMYERICKTKNRSTHVALGYEIPTFEIYKPFTQNDFRDARYRNKKYLTKEFSKDRIRTRFITPKLFKSDEYKLRGFLVSFFDAPLIFCKLSSNIFPDGADIALGAVTKLLEEYKNVQVIINMSGGLENSQITSWIEFLEQKIEYSGKWLFIDGEINMAQFYASSDLSFFCKRSNAISYEHFVAMKYGCIPVVLKNGIYNDTISDILDDMTSGCGFKTTISPFEGEGIFENFNAVVMKALNLYIKNPASWKPIMENAMSYDSGWTFDKIEKFNRIYSAL